ncbi:MAG: hypothetical protein IJM37_02525 [Lachnospiraceae bacterium]|nr:hypothetical protein [Lachnospiraceae bacterium]
MKIFDIFSNKTERELPLKKIEKIFTDYIEKGILNTEFNVLTELPDSANDNTRNCRDMLLGEDKKVAYLMQDNNVVVVIGYKGE